MFNLPIDRRPKDAELIGRITGYDAYSSEQFFNLYQSLMQARQPSIFENDELIKWIKYLKQYKFAPSNRDRAKLIVGLARDYLSNALFREIKIAIRQAENLAKRRGRVVHSLLFGDDEKPVWVNPLATFLDDPILSISPSELADLLEDYRDFNEKLWEFKLRVQIYATGISHDGQISSGDEGLAIANLTGANFK